MEIRGETVIEANSSLPMELNTMMIVHWSVFILPNPTGQEKMLPFSGLQFFSFYIHVGENPPLINQTRAFVGQFVMLTLFFFKLLCKSSAVKL